MKVDRATALAAGGRVAALAVGLMLAAALGLFLLIGDCHAVSGGEFDAIRQCETAKRNAVLVFIALAVAMWLTSAVRARRGAPFARRLALLSGPVACVVSGVLF